MKTSHPDIIVTSPDGEYLMIVEVKLNNVSINHQNVIDQLKRTMIGFGCSVGLLVAGERVIVLRDSFDDSHGSSIRVVGEATLPNFLLPPGDCGKAGSRVSLERGGKPTRAVLTASNILNHDAGH